MMLFSRPHAVRPLGVYSLDDIRRQYRRMRSNNSMQFVNYPPEDTLRRFCQDYTFTLRAIYFYEESVNNDVILMEMKRMKIDLYLWRAEAHENLNNREYIYDYQRILTLDPEHTQALRKIAQFNNPQSYCTIS